MTMQNKNNTGDRLGRRDVVFASAAGLVFTFVYLVFAAKGMDPALWRDLTVAAGIAPPQTIFPGVWRVVAHALLSFVGPGGIAFTLTVLGSIVGGLCFLGWQSQRKQQRQQYDDPLLHQSSTQALT